MEIVKASEATFDLRPQMGEIFADGFYELGLKSLSKDKQKLANALNHIFQLEHYYVALDGEDVMGFAALATGKSLLKLDKKIIVQHFGFILGRFAYFFLNKFMANHKFPFSIPPNAGTIEFVATAQQHRGKGVAGKIIAHIMDVTPQNEYILEVVDTNAPAIKAYTKLGFAEFTRSPAPMGSGGKYLIYMKI